MAGTQIRVDLKDVSRKLGLLVESLRQALRQAIAERLFFLTRSSFEREASPEGAAWQPLSLGYALRKSQLFKSQGILRRSGTLFRTIFRGVEDRFAFVSTAPLPYAAIHQFGGLAGRGRKSRIPARPYLPTPETAEREGRDEAELVIKDALEKSGLE